MELKTHHKSNTTIIVIEANMLGSDYSQLLHDKIKEAISTGERNFIIQMEKVRRINSIGVGIIITAWTTVINAGGRFALVKLTDKVAQILSICETDQFIPIFDNENEALSHLEKR